MSFHKSLMGRGVLSDNAKKLSEVIDRVKKSDEKWCDIHAPRERS